MTAGETPARGGRVLLVDDEPQLLELFADLLTEGGWEVDTAPDGEAAVSLLGRHRYDVVLTDIDMPRMNGLALLRAVRARDLDLPVLLVTGQPRVETAVQALEQGALRYLMKPVRQADLLQAVDDAGRLHRIARLKREALSYLGADDKLLGDRAALEAGFARALLSLRMAYQPVVRSDDGRLFGYEALVRTSEPTIPHPGALFDAAERLGRVHELGRTVRASVARAFSSRPGATVLVNVHALELDDDELLSPSAPLSRIASSVVLEITERSSFEHVPELRARIQALRDLGFRLAVDDLGAGYAGLTSFAVLEPEVVKLDMALVRGVDTQPLKRRLIGSMARLCRELGMLVVAEGIETAAEREVVTELGCDLLQGYFIGRPAELPRAAEASPTVRDSAPNHNP